MDTRIWMQTGCFKHTTSSVQCVIFLDQSWLTSHNRWHFWRGILSAAVALRKIRLGYKPEQPSWDLRVCIFSGWPSIAAVEDPTPSRSFDTRTKLGLRARTPRSVLTAESIPASCNCSVPNQPVGFNVSTLVTGMGISANIFSWIFHYYFLFL